MSNTKFLSIKLYMLLHTRAEQVEVYKHHKKIFRACHLLKMKNYQYEIEQSSYLS